MCIVLVLQVLPTCSVVGDRVCSTTKCILYTSYLCVHTWTSVSIRLPLLLGSGNSIGPDQIHHGPYHRLHRWYGYSPRLASLRQPGWLSVHVDFCCTTVVRHVVLSFICVYINKCIIMDVWMLGRAHQ